MLPPMRSSSLSVKNSKKQGQQKTGSENKEKNRVREQYSLILEAKKQGQRTIFSNIRSNCSLTLFRSCFVEAEALIKATDLLFHEYDADHRFSADDICHMHQVWLGEIYHWAGQYRSVNISKGDFVFSMAGQIPQLMQSFEKDQLAKYTPCRFQKINDVVKALAEVHIELVLIHPFREGNGRCSRILASIMALQAGLPVLDFSIISRQKKLDYFDAVQIGMDRNYEPMEKLFGEIIESSI